MSSRKPRLPFTSSVRLFGVLLGASLALGSVACGAAPYGNDDIATQSATETTKEPSTATPSDCNAEDAGPNALQASQPPAEETPGLAGAEGAGGGEAVNPPPYNGHPTHNAE